MPTASKSGTRKATRQNWRGCDRPRSRPGPRSRPRPNPFTELAASLKSLICFHESHPDWFPPVSDGGRPQGPPVSLSPEWEEAIRKAYHPDLGGAGAPPDVSFSAEGGDGRAAPSAAISGQS